MINAINFLDSFSLFKFYENLNSTLFDEIKFQRVSKSFKALTLTNVTRIEKSDDSFTFIDKIFFINCFKLYSYNLNKFVQDIAKARANEVVTIQEQARRDAILRLFQL